MVKKGDVMPGCAGDRTPFPVVDQWIVNQVYETLRVTDELLRHLEIPYTVSGGTLLGALRHQGLIPWDDDGDVDLLGAYVPRIRREAPNFLASRGFGIVRGGLGNFKVFSLRGRQTLFDTRAPYPSTDLFPLREDAEGRLVHAHEGAVDYWPRHCYLPGELDTLRLWDFGPLELSGIARPAAVRYLDDMYGTGWSEEAYLISDHVENKRLVKNAQKLTHFAPAHPDGFS